MKKINKSEIMKSAWEIARYGAKKFGGKAKEYLAEALKKAWETAKSLVTVPAWFVAKKLNTVDFLVDDAMAVIERETEKAVLVRLVEYKETVWCPKSVLA